MKLQLKGFEANFHDTENRLLFQKNSHGIFVSQSMG